MAIFKGLVAPVAGNNHNKEKEYDIHSDTAVNRLRKSKGLAADQQTITGHVTQSCGLNSDCFVDVKFTLLSLLPPHRLPDIPGTHVQPLWR